MWRRKNPLIRELRSLLKTFRIEDWRVERSLEMKEGLPWGDFKTLELTSRDMVTIRLMGRFRSAGAQKGLISDTPEKQNAA